MDAERHRIHVDDDQEEVARVFERFGWIGSAYLLAQSAIMIWPSRYPIQHAMDERGVSPGPVLYGGSSDDYMKEKMPAVNAVYKPIRNVYTKDDPETWQEIQSTGHAAVVGVGH